MNDPKMRQEALAELIALHKDASARGDTALVARLEQAIRRIEADAPVVPRTFDLAALPVEERHLLEKLTEADKRMAEQRWAEARDLLASIDRSSLPVAIQPPILHGLVFAMAQAGEEQRAMELLGNAMMDASARYKSAFERGDRAQAEQLAALMRALSGAGDSPEQREMEKVGQGERLILEERWADARDVLASIDRAMLPAMNRPGILNNLAYATAHAGDPERAIELIVQGREEAEAMGPDYPREKLPFLRGTHGVSSSLAGKHEDAVALLEPLLAIENPVRARTVRAYYLGQSLRALGRITDAARALEIATKGDGPFAPRAEAALAELRSTPQA